MNWSQLATILWLRRRLTANLWRRSGAIGPVIAVLVTVAGVVFGLGSFTGAFLGGFLGLAHAGPSAVHMTWTALTGAFLFFWFIGLLSELQRAESIDLQKLMHLPAELGQLFVINYVASHFTPGIVLFLPAVIGLALGLACARGLAFLWLLPLGVSAILMVTAWTYCLRGWLGALMANPRRRRAIIMGITFALVVLFQLPNLYFNVLNRPERGHRRNFSADQLQTLKAVFHAQVYVPPFWLATGARGLAEGRQWPAALGLAGCLLLGVTGIRRAYRISMRAYRGEEGGRARVEPQPVTRAPGAAPRRLFVERRMPGLPEPASAVATATLVSMARAPEVKMALGISVVVPVFIAASILMRGSPSALPEGARPFVITGLSLFGLFMSTQFVTNVFGYDRAGFRGLLLTPVDRRWFLLGKNLAFLPVGWITGAVLIIAAGVWLSLPALVIAAALVRLVGMLLVTVTVGNLFSILLPYRMAAGSLKASKPPALTMVAMIFGQFLFPVLLAPAFLPPLFQLAWNRLGLPAFVPVDFGLSLLMTATMAGLYWVLLGPAGRLLHRRETRILQAVSAEVE